jgi:hypothetical protein
MAPLALGIAAEGCGEMLAPRVGDVLPAVINLFRDGDNGVRHCACFCVGQWIEHMEDVLTLHHAAIIPEAFMLLDTVSPPHAPVPDVQRGALYVLECFSERLPADTLAPYLDQLMGKIVGLLQTAAVSAAIKSMALCVASTAAINAEQHFLPYFQRMAPGIKALMEISDPTQLLLRAKAMQAMGQMAVAVGCVACARAADGRARNTHAGALIFVLTAHRSLDVPFSLALALSLPLSRGPRCYSAGYFEEHFSLTMQRAGEGLQLNDVVLDENTYIFFANMAQVRLSSSPSLSRRALQKNTKEMNCILLWIQTKEYNALVVSSCIAPGAGAHRARAVVLTTCSFYPPSLAPAQ